MFEGVRLLVHTNRSFKVGGSHEPWPVQPASAGAGTAAARVEAFFSSRDGWGRNFLVCCVCWRWCRDGSGETRVLVDGRRRDPKPWGREKRAEMGRDVAEKDIDRHLERSFPSFKGGQRTGKKRKPPAPTKQQHHNVHAVLFLHVVCLLPFYSEKKCYIVSPCLSTQKIQNTFHTPLKPTAASSPSAHARPGAPGPRTSVGRRRVGRQKRR